MNTQDINKLIDIVSKKIYDNKSITGIILTNQYETKELKFIIHECTIPGTSMRSICIRYCDDSSMRIEVYFETIPPKDAKLTYEEARKQMSENLAKDFIDKILSKLVIEVKLAWADKRVEDLLNEIEG